MLDRFDDRIGSVFPGHHDDARVGLQTANLAEEFDSAHVRRLDLAQNHVVRPITDLAERMVSVRRGVNFGKVAQRRRECLQGSGVVVNEEDPFEVIHGPVLSTRVLEVSA